MSETFPHRASFLDFLLGRIQQIPVFQGIYNVQTQENLQEIQEYPKSPETRSLFSIFDAPSYLKGTLFNTGPSYRQLEIPLVKGYLINLESYGNLEDYLTHQFGKTSRRKLRRYRNRLDLCLEPTYKMYFGDIERAEYDRLFQAMRTMLVRRFEEKQEKNFELPILNIYKDALYDAILKKKGSFFVIYDQNKPINLCINFLYGQTMLSCNSVYDIDYDVFNLGKIDMYAHLKWCMENGIQLIDLGRGDFEHKRKWVNQEYLYHRLVFYRSTSIKSGIQARSIQVLGLIKHHLISVLKSLGAHQLFRFFLRTKYALTKQGPRQLFPEFTLKLTEEPFNRENAVQIDPYTNEFPYLQKPLNSFLYKNKEKKKDIEVFRLKGTSLGFFVVGKNMNGIIEFSR